MPKTLKGNTELSDAIADLEQLPLEAQRIVGELIALLRSRYSPSAESRSNRSLLELQGLGKEIWKDEPAETYVRHERESWDR